MHNNEKLTWFESKEKAKKTYTARNTTWNK